MSNYVDLHVHSYFSDGTMSPEEILKTAKNAGVSVLAITDHDVLDGSRELLRLAEDYDIKCITGIELDVVEQGVNFHVLAYNIDLNNHKLITMAKRNEILLEKVNELLILKIANERNGVSLNEYKDFNYDRRLGGWKALHYFKYKGLTEELYQGISIYLQYNHRYDCVKFPEMKEVCNIIHNAGGKAILAHPGKVIRTEKSIEFKNTLKGLINKGIDGIECYYPSHTKEITEMCQEVCR